MLLLAGSGHAHSVECWEEGQLVGGHRTTDVIALRAITTQFTEQVQRFNVLNPFGDDSKAHIVSELDRRAHEFEVAFLAFRAESGDEATVELEFTDGQAAQMG